jgi:hypothetical protein
MTPHHSLFLLATLLLVISCHTEIIELYPDETLFRESMKPGQSQLYKLNNLKKDKKYELRVSYPAIVGYNIFKFYILDASLFYDKDCIRLE